MANGECQEILLWTEKVTKPIEVPAFIRSVGSSDRASTGCLVLRNQPKWMCNREQMAQCEQGLTLLCAGQTSQSYNGIH